MHSVGITAQEKRDRDSHHTVTTATAGICRRLFGELRDRHRTDAPWLTWGGGPGRLPRVGRETILGEVGQQARPEGTDVPRITVQRHRGKATQVPGGVSAGGDGTKRPGQKLNRRQTQVTLNLKHYAKLHGLPVGGGVEDRYRVPTLGTWELSPAFRNTCISPPPCAEHFSKSLVNI
jgi:hypothetical protein